MASGSITHAGLLDVLGETRTRTLALVAGLGDDQLSRVVTPLLSPLVWDLGHIANFERRWLIGGEDEPFDELYDPFRQPRTARGELPILSGEDCFAYMERVRERVIDRFDDLDAYLVELVIQHEQQHNETMLQLLRMLDGYAPPPLDPGVNAGNSLRGRALQGISPESGGWVRFPAATYRVGTAPGRGDQLVYDNETGEHDVTLGSFEIAALPVTNGEYREWIENAGYSRPEHWSPAGREWLAAEGVNEPLGWLRVDGDGGVGQAIFLETGFGDPRPLDDDAPVTHISWFEADAFARAHGARLPTEFEWEVAAAHDPADVAAPRRRHPWGDEAWRPGLANLDQLAFGTLPAGACENGRVGEGPVDMAGQVWEWTSSEFLPYPGFRPFRYERYSAPFFNAGYRVLRGGSWATRARTVDNRFRNWDHPQRRQIFAGVRLARSA